MKYALGALAAATAVMFAGEASAIDIQTLPSDAPTHLAGTGLTLNDDFVAEGRIGDRGGSGEREVIIGNTAQSSLQDGKQFDWVNGEAYAFKLNYDGSTASFDVGGTTASFVVGPHDVNALLFRISAGTDSSVALTDMMIGGTPIDDFSYTATGGAYDDRVEAMLVSGIGDLSSGFMLTGDATLTWDDTNVPLRSALAFQVKTGSVPGTVPAPATVALLGVGLAGLGFLQRKRAQ